MGLTRACAPWGPQLPDGWGSRGLVPPVGACCPPSQRNRQLPNAGRTHEAHCPFIITRSYWITFLVSPVPEAQVGFQCLPLGAGCNHA